MVHLLPQRTTDSLQEITRRTFLRQQWCHLITGLSQPRLRCLIVRGSVVGAGSHESLSSIGRAGEIDSASIVWAEDDRRPVEAGNAQLDR